MSRSRDNADAVTTVPSGVGRNMVINGAMNVAQRSASVTGIGAANGYFTCDRWKTVPNSTAGRFTMTQTADGPSGFANCIKLDCTTADTSIAAAENLLLRQSFEGQNLQRIGKGVAGAKEVTVSFYVKANAAFDFALELQDADNSRQITKLFATTTDWVRHEITFPADVDDGSSPFDDDNAASLHLTFWLHAGATYTSGTLNTAAFADQTNANRAVGIDSFFSSTDNNFFITGVQMEVGPVATEFEQEDISTTLAKCQRYCQRFPTQDQADSGAYSSFGTGWATTTTVGQLTQTLPTTMRLEPTATFTGTFRFNHENTATIITSGPVINDIYSSVSVVNISGTVGSTALTLGSGLALTLANDNDANFILDAEL
tara:strand:+ start:132 stop:1250 length:1119 start_codon:yes stop_codon:yes gene_type:complete